MPEIGATLREARMRAKLDVTEVEAHTKIRAKYLRALENEEWNLLPGSTFVKTFLRTYAEFLGLDARLLVEEYKSRYEPVSSAELTPFSPQLGLRRERPRRQGPSRGVVIGGILVAIVVSLYLLSFLGSGGSSDSTRKRVTTPVSTAKRPATTGAPATRSSRTVRVQILPAKTVYVCLVDARGRRLINGLNVVSGVASRTYSSRRFRVLLGNGFVTLRVDGRRRAVPDVGDAIGYSITARRLARLPRASWPSCP